MIYLVVHLQLLILECLEVYLEWQLVFKPNLGILSVGTIKKKPVVKETDYGDVIVVRSMMYITLGYDHRLIDSAYGTRFLAK